MKCEECVQSEDNEKPQCLVMKVSGIGERRRYKGLLQPFVAHTHEYYVLGFVEKGARHLCCNGREYELVPGDMIVLNPGDSHGCEQVSHEPFAYESITVGAETFDRVRLKGPIVADEEAKTLFKYALDLIDIQNSQSAFLDSNEDRLLETVLALGHLLRNEEESIAKTLANEDAARNVYNYFCDHLAQPQTIRHCAEMVHLSPYALIRAYVGVYALTPLQHLLSLRVERARELLVQNLELSVVTEQCGFADQPHFTREFKKRMGLTPGAYQRMVIKTRRSA